MGIMKMKPKDLVTKIGNELHKLTVEVPKYLEQEEGYRVTYLPVDENGQIRLDALREALCEETILVSIMSVNNEVGTIEPIEEIGKLLKDYPKIFFHVDATQAIGKIKIDYKDVDLISMSGHKIHSFKSFGVLVKKKNVNLLSMNTGGGHQNGFRSGTTNVPAEIAIAKAIRFAFENQEKHFNYVRELHNYLIEKLQNIEGVKINAKENVSPFILSFSVPKKASVVQEALSEKEIYVSTKSACSSKKEFTSYVLEAMKKDKWDSSNSIRVSFSYKNTKKEIDIFIKELKCILNNLK